MQVVILCGGKGTRLREETEYRPKPLVEVGGRPILWHIMKTYAHFGHKDFVLCLGYRGEMIKQYFLNYEAMASDFTVSLGKHRAIAFEQEHQEQDYRVTLAETGDETLTGGRVKRIQKYIKDDCFMVTYGDGLADINVERLLGFHRSHGKIATVTTTRPTSRFGVLQLDQHAQVQEFSEKPSLDGWINAGFFVFNREIFDYLEGDQTALELLPLQRLASEGQLMAYRHEGFFFAMDTYREYVQLGELWNSGKPPWKVWS